MHKDMTKYYHLNQRSSLKKEEKNIVKCS